MLEGTIDRGVKFLLLTQYGKVKRVTVVLFEGILPRQHESQASNQAFCIDRMLVGASERGAKSYRWLSVRD